jgi:hypothetical protein
MLGPPRRRRAAWAAAPGAAPPPSDVARRPSKPPTHRRAQQLCISRCGQKHWQRECKHGRRGAAAAIVERRPGWLARVQRGRAAPGPARPARPPGPAANTAGRRASTQGILDNYRAPCGPALYPSGDKAPMGRGRRRPNKKKRRRAVARRTARARGGGRQVNGSGPFNVRGRRACAAARQGLREWGRAWGVIGAAGSRRCLGGTEGAARRCASHGGRRQGEQEASAAAEGAGAAPRQQSRYSGCGSGLRAARCRRARRARGAQPR